MVNTRGVSNVPNTRICLECVRDRFVKVNEKKQISARYLSVKNICSRYTLEPTRRDGSYEYPQHMFFYKEIRSFIL